MKFTRGRLPRVIVVSLSCSLLLCSCQKTEEPVEDAGTDPSLDNIIFETPNGWPAPVYTFGDNQLSREGFKLGRALFFEPMLSNDNKVSCGSCHQPFATCAQLGYNVSYGVTDRMGIRISPSLFDFNWHIFFGGDSGIRYRKDQMEGPVTYLLEMDETLDNVVRKLQARAHYRKMFKEAFGTEEVTDRRIFKAIAQFMGLMAFPRSKYSRYINKERGGNFTAGDLNGPDAFPCTCRDCSSGFLYSDSSLGNNGLSLLPRSQSVMDVESRCIHLNDAASFWRFNVPALRNPKFTATYMHGSISSP